MSEIVKTKREASRKLSTFEFFQQIQVEFIVAALRAKIYTKAKDKIFWNKVMEGKKQTILEIAERNQLPSLFDDSDLLSFLNKRVYGEGYPTFTYRDHEQELAQSYFDSLYYYTKGVEVRFRQNGEIVVGKVVSYKPLSKEVTVQIGSEEPIVVQTNICARIL